MIKINCPACDSHMCLRPGYSHVKMYYCDNNISCPIINQYSIRPNVCINNENDIFLYYFGVTVHNNNYLLASVFGSPNHIVVQNSKKILCKLDYIKFSPNYFKDQIGNLILRLGKLVTLI